MKGHIIMESGQVKQARYKSRAKPTEEEKLAIIDYYLTPNNLRPTADKFNRSIPIIKQILVEYNIPEHSTKIRHACAARQSQQTCLEKYGVEFSFQSENHKQKSKETLLTKFGVDNPARAAVIQDRIKLTNLQKYGVENPMMLKKFKQKSFGVRKQRGTAGSSAAEERAFLYLSSKYKNVMRQYIDIRYPFHCDFYIEELDTFIELNLHWSHGYKKFEGSSQDLERLKKWQEKAESSDYYKSAIEVWTKKDLQKINTAKENNLKYITVYKEQELYNLI